MAGKKRPDREPESDTTRARDPAPPPVWARVRTIRRHLEERTWTGEVAQALAEEWGISEAMVRGHAAEAQRQLEAVLDAGQAARQIGADLELGLAMAMAQEDPFALKGLLEAKMRLHGLGAHRDSRNDPKPGEKPEGGKVVQLPWKKKA